MITKDYQNIADIFMEISAEPVLRRRQALFLELYSENDMYKTFLCHAVSLSVALDNVLDVSPRVTPNSHRIAFSDAAGNVLYHILEGNNRKAKKELYKFPHYLQVILSFIFTKRILSQLSNEFLFNTIENLDTLPQLLAGFINLPEEEADVFLEEEVSFSRKNLVTLPFMLLKRPKKQRIQGKLYYLISRGGTVSTNIRNKSVKEYLAKKCSLTEYGIIVSVVFNKKRGRVKYIQPVILSQSPDDIKNYYKGTAKGFPKSEEFHKYFSAPPSTIEVSVKHLQRISQISDMLTTRGMLDNGNLVLHKDGIAILHNKPKIKKAKVIDYFLNDDYEPIGYRVNIEGHIYDLQCTVTSDDVDRGIDGLFLNVKQTLFLGEVVKNEFSSVLSSRYRECALCGGVYRLISKYCCFDCNAMLFKVAASDISKHFELTNLRPYKPGVKFSLDKYRIEFLNKSVRFIEDFSLVKGKQLRLPYNWWDRDKWPHESSNFKSLSNIE